MKKSVIIGIIVIILIIIVGGFFYFYESSSQPTQLEGEESLEVKILSPDNNSINDLEVDLWTSEKANGPPSAGILITNKQGIVLFKVPKGEYLIGFNSINFPEEFVYPEKISIIINKGENYKVIVLELK